MMQRMSIRNTLPSVRSTHADRLERWLGAEKVEAISRNMAEWYGPPIALQGVPGAVFADRGGGFIGRIEAGSHCSAVDRAESSLRRANKARFRNAFLRQAGMAGFASLSDLIAEASTGKRREWTFNKVGVTGVVNVPNSLWGLGNLPPAGAASSAAPGGIAPTDATTGAIPFDNVSADTRHFVMAGITSSVAANALMLYDRIFGVAKTASSTATESVTGVPTRYQSSTTTAADYAGGNFCFVEVGSAALGATAHNWTVCQYRNQAGTDAQSFPSMTGNSGAIARRLDHPLGSWFMPLNASDVGVMDLHQMQNSASVTGALDFVIGHPLAFMPCPVANMICLIDGINTAFNLVRIFDDAALAFLEMPKPATTATTYSGTITAVHG